MIFYKFCVLILSILIISYFISFLVESCNLGSGASVCLPVVIIGGPLLGILVGLIYLEQYPSPPFHILINFSY